MNEQIPTNENNAEKILNEREVFNQFEKILNTREFEEIGKVEDENGLYSWDIKTTEEETGDRMDLIYQRSRILRDGSVAPPAIHETLYYGDIPCGVGRQFNYVSGGWVTLP